MTDETWMAETAAKYFTKVTVLDGLPNGWNQLLTANPRRWRVSFFPLQGGSLISPVLPGPVAQGVSIGGQFPAPLVSEFPKEPCVTTGEWWGNFTLGNGWIVIECIFTTEG